MLISAQRRVFSLAAGSVPPGSLAPPEQKPMLLGICFLPCDHGPASAGFPAEADLTPSLTMSCDQDTFNICHNF